MRPARSGSTGRSVCGSRASPVDPCRHLDHRLIGKEGQRAVIAQIDHLHITAIGDQRRHQIHRSLGVVGTATLLEQGWLLVHRRVGVDLQQLALDLGHLLGARGLRPLLLDDVIMFIEIAKVVRGHTPSRRSTSAGRPERPPAPPLRWRAAQVADLAHRPGHGVSRSGD